MVLAMTGPLTDSIVRARRVDKMVATMVALIVLSLLDSFKHYWHECAGVWLTLSLVVGKSIDRCAWRHLSMHEPCPRGIAVGVLGWRLYRVASHHRAAPIPREHQQDIVSAARLAANFGLGCSCSEDRPRQPRSPLLDCPSPFSSRSRSLCVCRCPQWA